MTLIVRADRLIDGSGAEPVSGPTVVVEDDRFAAVGASTPGDGERVDLDGCTLLPGLIDAHVHVTVTGFAAGEPPAVTAGWAFRHLERMLDLGITTARDTGGADGGLVAALDAGLVRGPRLVVCGPLLAQSGGHGDFSPPFVHDPGSHLMCVPGLALGVQLVDGPDQMRAAARLAFKRGARFLKLCVSGGVTSLSDELSDTQFGVDEIRAAVQEAAARGTYVTVHTHNKQGILNALEAGVTCFEHATALDDETAAAIAAVDGAIIPTLTVTHVYESYSWLSEQVRARVVGVGDGMAHAAKLGLATGLLVGSGADLIGADQSQYGMEIPLKAAAIGAMEAIVSATATNARILRMDDIGTVAPGKRADLVAVAGDPLADPWLLADPDNIKLVIKDGRIVKDAR
jgi:imidazolonepropionase-like amidohydrolase